MSEALQEQLRRSNTHERHARHTVESGRHLTAGGQHINAGITAENGSGQTVNRIVNGRVQLAGAAKAAA